MQRLDVGVVGRMPASGAPTALPLKCAPWFLATTAGWPRTLRSWAVSTWLLVQWLINAGLAPERYITSQGVLWMGRETVRQRSAVPAPAGHSSIHHQSRCIPHLSRLIQHTCIPPTQPNLPCGSRPFESAEAQPSLSCARRGFEQLSGGGSFPVEFGLCLRVFGG